MVFHVSVPKHEVLRCLLCHDAPCTKNCPHSIAPDSLLRSLRFENEIAAAERMPQLDCCAGCDAPCENACLLPERPVAIKAVLTALHQDKQHMEPLPSEAPNLSCTFCGVRLENPFLLSSSVVASSYEMLARAFRFGWAGAAYKTLCNFIPREASPRFSVVRNEETSFYGFKNIEQLSCNSLEEDLRIIARLKQEFPHKVIFASIMGRDEEEWTRLASRCQDAGADLVECNFSCPNMEQRGLGSEIGQNPDQVERLTAAARRGCTIPILAKLTPNVGDMIPAAQAALRGGADGLSAINTIKSIMGTSLDTYATSPSVRGLSGVGGYSGRAVKPIALRFVWELASHPALNGVPISGVGGIESWRDATEFLLLGAQNVQITTAVMQYGYRIIDDLLSGLSCYLREKGLHSVKELIGLGIASVAPLSALERGSVQYPKFLRGSCLGCGRCYLSCRDGGHDAIVLTGGHAALNPKRCVGCHLCVAVCPAGAISGQGKRLTEEAVQHLSH